MMQKGCPPAWLYARVCMFIGPWQTTLCLDSLDLKKDRTVCMHCLEHALIMGFTALALKVLECMAGRTLASWSLAAGAGLANLWKPSDLCGPLEWMVSIQACQINMFSFSNVLLDFLVSWENDHVLHLVSSLMLANPRRRSPSKESRHPAWVCEFVM